MSHLNATFSWIFKSDVILGMSPQEIADFRNALIYVGKKMECYISFIFTSPIIWIAAIGFLSLWVDAVAAAACFLLFFISLVGLNLVFSHADRMLNCGGLKSHEVSRLQNACNRSAWAKKMRDSLAKEGHKLCPEHVELIASHANNEKVYRKKNTGIKN